MCTLSLRCVLRENAKRAMDDLPPVMPSVISHVVRNCKVTAQNEMEAMAVAMRIKTELLEAYKRIHGIFCRPCITVAIFKEVDAVEKDAWQVIAREMERIG